MKSIATRWIPMLVATAAILLTAGAGPSGAAGEDAPIPPSGDRAKAALEQSPRHGEWVDVKGIKTWVVYPERKDKAPVVIVVHEIFGLTDWVRAVADRLAADGFLAVAPDLLSGKGPGGGGSETVPGRDEAVKLVSALTPAEVAERLDLVRDHALKLPAASGGSGVIGFCWGGSTSFTYATTQPGLDAAVVFYGTAPSGEDAYSSIKAPVLGLYGGDDARVNATIETAATHMAKLGRTYEKEIYDGAGHGFLRAQDGREGANLKAAQAAWPRAVAFLREHVK